MSRNKTNNKPIRHVCILVSQKDREVFYIPYREINFKPTQLLRLRFVPKTHDVPLEVAKRLLLSKLTDFNLSKGFKGFVPLDSFPVDGIIVQPVAAVIAGHTLRGNTCLKKLSDLSKEKRYLRDVNICPVNLLARVA